MNVKARIWKKIPVALKNKKQKKKTKQDKIKLNTTKQAKQMFKCNNQGHCRTPTSTNFKQRYSVFPKLNLRGSTKGRPRRFEQFLCVLAKDS